MVLIENILFNIYAYSILPGFW